MIQGVAEVLTLLLVGLILGLACTLALQEAMLKIAEVVP